MLRLFDDVSIIFFGTEGTYIAMMQQMLLNLDIYLGLKERGPSKNGSGK